MQYVALYDYDPQTSSPNDEPSDELSLTTGDTVTVLKDVRDDGFVKAEVRLTSCKLCICTKFHEMYINFMNALACDQNHKNPHARDLCEAYVYFVSGYMQCCVQKIVAKRVYYS